MVLELLIILTIILFAIGYYYNYEYYRLRQFPVLEGAGNVVSSSLENESNKFKINVTYKYTIKGKEYVSNKVGYNDVLYDYDIAADKLQKYRDADKLGTGMDVISNPMNPTESYLDIGVQHNSYYIGSIVSLIVTLLWFNYLC